LKAQDRCNKLQQFLPPNADDAGVWILRDAWFHLRQFDQAKATEYTIKNSGHGFSDFLLSGEMTENGQKLFPPKGLGIWDISKLKMKADAHAEMLLMEIPMQVSQTA
jgi:hypothetical protein